MANIESLSTREAVIQFLQSKPGTEYKSREIAKELKEKYKLKYGKKEEIQLAAEISAGAPKWMEQHKQLRCSEDTPRKFWWEVSGIKETVVSIPNESGASSLKESDLYQLLAEFMYKRPRKIYPKRIDEKKSSNSYGKDGNKWLHPDMVGLEDLTSGWNYKMKDLAAKAGAKQAKLWSFEVKIEIPRSKVREYYFQAVSNSTWANFGYLVAVKIKSDAWSELRLLNELHGIGVIELDTTSPADSLVSIPARERHEIDWGTCNRIADENSHFREYIKLIAHFYESKETSIKEWDVPADKISDD